MASDIFLMEPVILFGKAIMHHLVKVGKKAATPSVPATFDAVEPPPSRPEEHKKWLEAQRAHEAEIRSLRRGQKSLLKTLNRKRVTQALQAVAEEDTL